MAIMQSRVDALNDILGVDAYDDPILQISYDYPLTLSSLILSDKVFVRK